MNKKLLIAVFVSAMAHTFACAASPKENRMKTVWADKVTSAELSASSVTTFAMDESERVMAVCGYYSGYT